MINNKPVKSSLILVHSSDTHCIVLSSAVNYIFKIKLHDTNISKWSSSEMLEYKL